MALRADSYGSVEEVRALTRHLLDGAGMFHATTRPTLEDVETMIDRWSAVLNIALAGRGVAVPVTNEIAELACAQWVVRQAAIEVELTQRGTGFNEFEDSRLVDLRMDSVAAVADQIAAGLIALSPSSGPTPAYQGISFTGTSVTLFTRGMFDIPGDSE